MKAAAEEKMRRRDDGNRMPGTSISSYYGKMNLMAKKSPFDCEFDFEIGTLIQSPCRECERRKTTFPACSQECLLLAQVQTVLAASVSCAKKG
jgi:hypothetical protein